MVNSISPAAPVFLGPMRTFTRKFYDISRLALFFRPDWNQNCY